MASSVKKYLATNHLFTSVYPEDTDIYINTTQDRTLHLNGNCINAVNLISNQGTQTTQLGTHFTFTDTSLGGGNPEFSYYIAASPITNYFISGAPLDNIPSAQGSVDLYLSNATTVTKKTNYAPNWSVCGSQYVGQYGDIYDDGINGTLIAGGTSYGSPYVGFFITYRGATNGWTTTTTQDVTDTILYQDGVHTTYISVNDIYMISGQYDGVSTWALQMAYYFTGTWTEGPYVTVAGTVTSCAVKKISGSTNAAYSNTNGTTYTISTILTSTGAIQHTYTVTYPVTDMIYNQNYLYAVDNNGGFTVFTDTNGALSSYYTYTFPSPLLFVDYNSYSVYVGGSTSVWNIDTDVTNYQSYQTPILTSQTIVSFACTNNQLLLGNYNSNHIVAYNISISETTTANATMLATMNGYVYNSTEPLTITSNLNYPLSSLHVEGTILCDTLTATNINITNFTATNANNILIASSTTNANFYPTFVSSTTGGYYPEYVSSYLSYNPSTEILTANVTNNVISSTSSGSTFYPVFVSGTSGNLGLFTNSSFTYNPALNETTTSVNGLQGRNLLDNGDFQVWQRGTSFSLGSGNYQWGPDRWELYASATSDTATCTKVAGATTQQEYCRVQRTVANSTMRGTYSLIQPLLIERCLGIQGQELTVSFVARIGTTFSGASNQIQIVAITGTNSNDISGTYTAYSSPTTALSISQTLTTTATAYSARFAVGATATAMNIQFKYTTSGTNVTADYFDITNIQLEISQFPTNFERLPFSKQLMACQYYYQPIYGGAGFCGPSNVIFTLGFTVPVVMRITPIPTSYGVLYINDGSTTYAQSSYGAGTMTLYAPTNANGAYFNGGLLNIANYAGLTSYRPAVFETYVNNNLLWLQADIPF